MPNLWPHIPGNFIERLRFSTDVRQTPEGEYRDSLHDGVIEMSMQHTVEDAEAERMRQRFDENALGEWYLPIWQDATHFVGTIAASEIYISVDTDADYRAGGKAVILSDDQTWEVVDVASAAGGLLTLSTATTQSYSGTEAAPVLVAPVVTALAVEPLARSVSYAITRATIGFRATEPYDLAPASPIYPVYNGSEVMTDPIAVLSGLQGAVFRQNTLIDSGFGAITFEDSRDFVEQRASIAFADYTNADRLLRRQWLHYIRGRDRSWWLPSQKSDLVLESPIGASDTTITVTKVGGATSGYVGRHIQIDDDGTLYRREITAASSGSTTSTLTMDSSLGAAVPVSATVSLMTLVRLDADRVEIQHRPKQGGVFSTMQTTVLEVPA